ncbi:MAG TPA: hypothetical protein VMK53_06220 [Gemmatimonadales bacterium]|nr:hypothetical protein [Gemmatimonadales bacterium]
MPSLSYLLTLLQPAAPGGGAVGALWGGAAGATSPFGWAPVILLGGPLLVAVVLLWLYARTAREHRRAVMAPPVWLLPYLERPSEADSDWRPPPPDADHAELEQLRQESTAQLARRKRGLLIGLGLNFVAAWAAAGAYLYTGSRSVEFQELPPTVALGASVDTLTFQGIEGPGTLVDDPAPPPPPLPAAPTDVTPDTAQLRIRREQLALSARRRDSLAEVRRRDSIAMVEAVALRLRDSVAQVVRDSITRAQAAVVPAPVRPPPPPPPPPPPAPSVDPAVDLARAVAAIRARAEALAAAINARAGLPGLLTAGPERERFLRFVEQRSPAAAVDRVPAPTVVTSRAETVVTLELQWRGPFGDTRRGAGRFQVEAVRVDGAWQVARLVALNTPQ